MKTRINSLTDALAHLLQGLYYAETKLIEEFPKCCNQISSARLKSEVNKYTESSESKLLKLERVFNYLLKEPLTRNNRVIDELLNETHEMLSSTTPKHLRDVLSIGCIQNMNVYKIAGYRTAHLFAAELELDTATDIIQEILTWEIETSKELSSLTIEEFNKKEQLN